MGNQTLIAGQTTTLLFGSPAKAGDPPGHIYIAPPAGGIGLEVDGPGSGGWTVSDWEENKAAGSGTAKVTLAAGQPPSKGSTIWLNSASGLVYKCVVDVVAAPVVAAKPVPATVSAVAAPSTVVLQPIKIVVTFDAPCTITQAAMTLGQGKATWPNVPLTSNQSGAALTHTMTGTVPYPLPGFSVDEASADVTGLANGFFFKREVIVTMQAGEPN